MSHQRIVTLGDLDVQLVISKASCKITKRAERLVARVMANQVVRGMRPKVLQRKKHWLSYRVNRQYRILVQRSCCQTGPYYCLSHAEFDLWVNKH
ncbi:ParE family toxin-like protein [Shewanella aegiceratis]|uniref:ParE family toxin-like protein n=1 Tax=Shewanella aegiceratis TaxID=2864203 RepID=UPI003D9C879E